jgi:hypothetical protein
MHDSKYRFKILIFLLSLFFPLSSQAFDFNNIISDEEANNYQAMDQSAVTNFLASKNSFLKDFWYEGNNPSSSEISSNPGLINMETGEIVDGSFIKLRSAAEIIYNASQEAKLNPQFLLTILQKEQSLVESASPSERQLGYAMGYYCFDGDYCNPRFKGFGKQVRSAALQFRYYIDHIEEYDYQPGRRSCIDDKTPDLPCTSQATEITPANKVTAALYVYTPHLHGNELFANLWGRYGFGGEAVSGGNILAGIFPEGALVKAKDDASGTVYLISGGNKRAFASLTALTSRFDPNKVLVVDSTELIKYGDGQPIKFTNFSVVKDENDQRYLIDGLTKKLIATDEIFRQLGYNPEEVVTVTAEDLASFSQGQDLTATNSSSPFGQLMSDLTTKEIYYVKNNQKSSIIDSSIIKANYPTLKIKKVYSKTLNELETIGPVKLVDGTLIKRDIGKDVFVISNGYRRLIPDGQTFEAMGYKWSNIMTVPVKVINLHQIGPALASL